MKTIKQLVSFVLGVAVGVCLYSLLKLRPLSPALLSNVSPQVGTNQPRRFLRPPWVQRSVPPQVCAPVRVHSARHIHAMGSQVAEQRPRVEAQPEILKVAQPAATREVAAVNVSAAPPAPTVFKAIGYVEKAGGQVEAIILQENQVQVVHIGDLIAGRYRVTKVSPDLVDAVDETQAQSPMAKPGGAKSDELTASVAQQPSARPAPTAPAEPEVLAAATESDHPANPQSVEPVSAKPAVVAQARSAARSNSGREDRTASAQGADLAANSLGFVQKADGKIEAVVADGDTVRLVSDTPPVTMAQVTPPGDSQRGASRTQGSTALAATLSSIRGPVADSSVHPEGSSALPFNQVAPASRLWGEMATTPMDWGRSAMPPSVIRQASYQLPTAAPGAADGLASNRLGMSSTGEAAGTIDGASDPAASIAAQKSGMAILAMTAHGQDARATPPGASPDRLTKSLVEMKPLGFVVKADGELAAILSQDDEVYIVRQGDRFAGHYRAVSVSADAVEAVEEPPPRQAFPPPLAAPLPFPDLLSASAQEWPSLFSNEDCSGCSKPGEVSANVPEDPPAEVASPPPRGGTGTLPVSKHGQDGHATRGGTGTLPVRKNGRDPDRSGQDGQSTFIFQTLGYVETQDGELRAVVADGSEVYLVKQGETFADQYLATSVDPILVLAVKVFPGQHAGNILSAQTKSGGKPASKNLHGYLQFPSLGGANAPAPHEVGVPGTSFSLDLSADLLNSSLAGFDF